jgi:hypothetical protein
LWILSPQIFVHVHLQLETHFYLFYSIYIIYILHRLTHDHTSYLQYALPIWGLKMGMLQMGTLP